MDNARIHKYHKLRDHIKTTKSQIVYNVAYNPETNPIELLFSPLKAFIKSHKNDNINNLHKYVNKYLSTVTSKQLSNYKLI